MSINRNKEIFNLISFVLSLLVISLHHADEMQELSARMQEGMKM